MRDWRPLKPVPAGTLLPCGSNISGTIREFFANPADVPELLRDGIALRSFGRLERFRVALTATPYYGNGDVQIRVMPA